MGGSAGAGNVTPTAEFNVWADPHAAAIVFNAGFERFLMAGLNLTHQFGIDEDTIVGLPRSTIQWQYSPLIFSTSTSPHIRKGLAAAGPATRPMRNPAVTHPEIFTSSLELYASKPKEGTPPV